MTRGKIIPALKHGLGVLLFAGFLALSGQARAEKVTVAAAADLKFAMDEIVAAYQKANPGDAVKVVYGSSGKFHTQIRQGAPYDLFFSADIAYPRALTMAGYASSEAKPYAMGRLVLWSAGLEAERMTLLSLADPQISRIAIANPRHAPYGQRALEALKASGLWEKIAAKLVYGENVAQAAQFVQSGNAQVGIIALSLALNPELAPQGGYWLIPASLHTPLEQGYVITKRAAGNAAAKRFAGFMENQAARTALARYGFTLPSESTGR